MDLEKQKIEIKSALVTFYRDSDNEDYLKALENAIEEIQTIKNINYTRCCKMLKDKEKMTFDEFAKENNYKQDFLYFYRDGKTFNPSEVMKRYKRYLLSL